MKVFFDASVILAGLMSKTGGSAVLLRLSEKGKLKTATSRLVLEEVKRNIKKKLSKRQLIVFAEWLKKAKPQVVAVSQNEIKKYKEIVASKDAHVIAGAVKTKVKYLVTLDKKHLLKINQEKTSLSFKILTPGDLINLL
ncbi:putative toxin-antitoxin system toxin component, PIN family [Patescibacteria group bacterium]|nr:putative toxin-antitoxin system toxin component, PIN family [Patescibacteria group bacterium]